jgi:hypothetical protein
VAGVRILDLHPRPCGASGTVAVRRALQLPIACCEADRSRRWRLRSQRTREKRSGNKDDDPGRRLVCRHTADGGGAPLGMLEGGPEIFRNSSDIV